MKRSFYSVVVITFIIFCFSEKNKVALPDHCKDITNAILNRSSPYSQDYVGKYCAIIRDSNNHVTLNANFSIEHAGDKTVWNTDGLPNHDFNDRLDFANLVSEQSYVFEMPDRPGFAATKTPLSLDYYNAILLNGALVDLLSDGCCCPGPNPTGCGEVIRCSDTTNPWRKDPMFPGGEFRPDSHNAHAQDNGTYHYHGPPNALYDPSGKKESPVIGFAADGFPIYGPYINDHGTIRKVISSYRKIVGSRPTNSCPYNPEKQNLMEHTYKIIYTIPWALMVILTIAME